MNRKNYLKSKDKSYDSGDSFIFILNYALYSGLNKTHNTILKKNYKIVKLLVLILIALYRLIKSYKN